MKILHVSLGRPPLYTGGSVRYCEDLVCQQNTMGYVVGIIYPGHSSLLPGTRINSSLDHNGVHIYEIINPLPIAIVAGVSNPKKYYNECNTNCFDLFLDETKPDVIHVHSIMGIHQEFFASAKKRKIKMVFTTHDFYPLCLRYTFLDNRERLCSERSPENCMKCNMGGGLSPVEEKIIRSRIYSHIKYSSIMKKARLYARKYARLRQNRNNQRNDTMELLKQEDKRSNFSSKKQDEYAKLLTYNTDILKQMDLIHCNSDLTKSIYKKYVADLRYETISITHKELPIHNSKISTPRNEFRIGYLNGMLPNKGINVLRNAFNQLIDTDTIKWRLVLWGDDYSTIVEEGRILNKGRYRIDQLKEVFSDINILVVPSIGWDTFGFVVLEALTYGIPVVCSDRVGASILLKELPYKLIYNAEDANELVSIIMQLSKPQVYEATVKYLDQHMNHMGIEKHTQDMLKLYEM